MQAYNTVRAASGTGEGNGPWIVMHDAFLGLTNWAGFLPNADRMQLDIHQYLCFDGQSADDGSDEPAAAEMLLVVFMGWMIGARDAGIDADAVIAWLHEAFGKDEVMNFFPLMALLAPQTFSERGLDWTMTEMIDEAGDHVIRGAVAISAAVAATAGSGDARWLRQFDAQ